MRWLVKLAAICAAVCSGSIAHAQLCGPGPQINLDNSTTSSDTKLALAAVKNLFGSGQVEFDYKKQLLSIFSQFPNGLQYAVALIYYHDGCILIISDSAMGTEKKPHLLQELRNSIQPGTNLAPVYTSSPPQPQPAS
jgi:hypothetical protein